MSFERIENPMWLALVAALAVGCGGDAGDDGAEGGIDDEAETAAPAVDPAIAATIGGTITFAGTAPEPTPIDMSEEPVCAEKHDGQPMDQNVQVSGDGNLAGVFVFVSEGLGDQAFPASSEPVVIDQSGCRYDPHVLGIQTGQPLVIRNSDEVLHNINTQSTANRSFNISQPQAGMESTRTFNTAEVMIPVKCDVHGWMEAFIGVTAHPYNAVTGEDGTFTIEGLPPGTYTITAWHETLGEQTTQVTVGESETGTADFTYDENAAYAPVPMAEPVVVSHATGHAGG